jgi:hypothetical protein
MAMSAFRVTISHTISHTAEGSFVQAEGVYLPDMALLTAGSLEAIDRLILARATWEVVDPTNLDLLPGPLWPSI